MGWSLERTKEGGEAILHQRENEKLRSISQSSQVRWNWLNLEKKGLVVSLLRNYTKLCLLCILFNERKLLKLEF